MEFADLTELKKAFMSGDYNFDDHLIVAGIPYHKQTSSSHSMMDMLEKNYKGMMVYSLDPNHKHDADNTDLKPWILFLWGFTSNHRLAPYDVRTMTKARAKGKVITEVDKGELPDNIIGSTVEVRFTNLAGSGYMKGKVDTGATICSLHADNYKINRSAGTITFLCPQLSKNELTVPLVDQQAVKSADGGSEYRPVIELNIKVNNKLINNVKFNINDRSHMEFPILLGKNALEAGNFMINPKLDEGEETTEWDVLQEELRSEVFTLPENKNAKELYKIIKESDVSFADIVRYIRTDVTENVMEDLDN